MARSGHPTLSLRNNVSAGSAMMNCKRQHGGVVQVVRAGNFNSPSEYCGLGQTLNILQFSYFQNDVSFDAVDLQPAFALQCDRNTVFITVLYCCFTRLDARFIRARVQHERHAGMPRLGRHSRSQRY